MSAPESSSKPIDGGATTTKSIHIKFVPRQTRYDDLTDLFQELMPNNDISTVRIKSRADGRKFAFVDFEDDVEVEDGKRVECPWMEGWVLTLQAARPPREHYDYTSEEHEEDESEEDEHPNSSIYVGNLPRETEEQNLLDLFKTLCPDQTPVGVRIMKRENTLRPYAFVDFGDDVHHVLGGLTSISQPCPWASDVVLELQPAKPLRKKRRGGRTKNKSRGSSRLASEREKKLQTELDETKSKLEEANAQVAKLKADLELAQIQLETMQK